MVPNNHDRPVVLMAQLSKLSEQKYARCLEPEEIFFWTLIHENMAPDFQPNIISHRIHILC